MKTWIVLATALLAGSYLCEPEATKTGYQAVKGWVARQFEESTRHSVPQSTEIPRQPVVRYSWDDPNDLEFHPINQYHVK